jgi:hypothetical protein
MRTEMPLAARAVTARSTTSAVNGGESGDGALGVGVAGAEQASVSAHISTAVAKTRHLATVSGRCAASFIVTAA